MADHIRPDAHASRQDDNLSMFDSDPRLAERKVRRTDLNPYQTKIVTQGFVLLASVVVFGSVADEANYTEECGGLCVYGLIVGLFSAVFLAIVLFLNYLSKQGSLSRSGRFSHRFEMQLMMFLVVWWTAGVGGVASAEKITTGVGVVFAWLAFLGSIFATFKAFQTRKEEDERWAAYGYESPVSDEEENVHLAENVEVEN
eukprot:Plantae.Rhodophyta-Rhodochaete_pulchella.ctg121.p1 GENE.Plantae.Rhodophyta-Rhodochaete_pulchella.ctg121~~Plantae.Rhodophyta-Rhodochaete_pulchella.ctg121.p1  ORF type:complete len:200 (-),score=37.71 Plantae.Rhodophyta-Rhodochaete_pulchella.ctg121:310-909(-)